MRTILIDPEAQTVTELDFEGDFRDIQKTIDCGCFTTLNINGPKMEAIYVDDEGLLKGSGFVFSFMGQPLVGKGLVMGCDMEGESIGTDMPLSAFTDQIEWMGECTFNL